MGKEEDREKGGRREEGRERRKKEQEGRGRGREERRGKRAESRGQRKEGGRGRKGKNGQGRRSRRNSQRQGRREEGGGGRRDREPRREELTFFIQPSILALFRTEAAPTSVTTAALDSARAPVTPTRSLWRAVRPRANVFRSIRSWTDFARVQTPFFFPPGSLVPPPSLLVPLSSLPRPSLVPPSILARDHLPSQAFQPPRPP
jgi:hypothetical protein